MKINYFSLLIIPAFIITLFPNFAGAETVKLWGSTTCQKRFLEPGSKAFFEATGIKIKVYGVGTGKGMIALFTGKSQVAISSNNLAGSINSAHKVRRKQGKPLLEVPKGLQFHTITEDLIVPIVHKSNTVKALTWKQLSDINTGKIKNWSEVSGPHMPIQVVTSHAGSSTKAVFQKMVMKKAPYVEDAILVRKTRLEIMEVSKNVGGIGAVSAGFYNLNPANTRIVSTDSISRPLGLITIGDPTPEVQKVIDFFKSAEGKKYILD